MKKLNFKKTEWLVGMATALFLAGLVILGIYSRTTYTDVLADEEYLSRMDVAVLSEDSTIMTCGYMEDELEAEAVAILKVEIAEGIEYLPGESARQKAVVREIFKGTWPSEGETIYLYSDHWGIHIRDEPASVECGFVNIPIVGKEYLVFLSQKVTDLYQQQIPAYELVNDFYIAPVFSYEDVDNHIPTEDFYPGSTYVPYSDLADNEFFGATQTALDTWKVLKSTLLLKYN